MKGDFVDMWEEKSDEELFTAYIGTVVGARATGLHNRRSAARILARRKHQPAGDVLIEWLKKPKKGIGQYLVCEWGTATSPPQSWFEQDTEERFILHLSVESLGLMRYKTARAALEVLLSDGRIVQYSLIGSLGNQKLIQRSAKHLEGSARWALKRLENPDIPETGIDDDMLLYIASERPDFFREEAFKGLATQMITRYGRDAARMYFEALRKVPDIYLHADSGEKNCPSGCGLIPLVASIGFRYGNNQQEFNRLCQELFNMVKTSRGFERGVSHTTVILQNCLYDGSDARLNDGVEMAVREYIDASNTTL